jgi:hypothetical protein
MHRSKVGLSLRFSLKHKEFAAGAPACAGSAIVMGMYLFGKKYVV